MKILDIYTDGSHLKHTTGRLGIGSVLIDLSKKGPYGEKLDEFNEELGLEWINQEFGTSNCSNPTAEMIAVLVALQQFRPLIKNADMINIHADYIGVREWMTEKWTAKESYIIKIKQEIKKEIERQRKVGRINFIWIKGHQKLVSGDPDIYWNSYVDKLAKGEINE